MHELQHKSESSSRIAVSPNIMRPEAESAQGRLRELPVPGPLTTAEIDDSKKAPAVQATEAEKSRPATQGMVELFNSKMLQSSAEINSDRLAPLTLALAFASKGFKVFPCGLDKQPLTMNGFKDASDDMETLKSLWARCIDASIGFPTGAVNGVSVVDLDIDPKNGVDGCKSFLALAEANGGIPSTFTVKTPRGGKHLYFKHREGVRCTIGALGKGIDTRGEGGYVIAPGSFRPDGEYVVESANEIAEMPEWLFQSIAAPGAPVRVSAPAGRFVADAAKVQDALSFIDPDCSYDSWCKAGMALHAWDAKEGFRLWNEWSGKAKGKYKGEGDLLAHWRSFSSEGGRTICSLFAMARESGWRPKALDGVVGVLFEQEFRDEETGESLSGAAWVERCALRKERGLGDLYASLSQGRRLYDHTAKSWMIFEEGRWMRDPVERIERELSLLLNPFLAAVLQLRSEESEALKREIQKAKVRGSGKAEMEQLAKKLESVEIKEKALKSGQDSISKNISVSSISKMAARALGCESSAFDSDPMLLNCLNGTLNLESMEFFDGGDPELMQSKCANVEYDPSASAPKFLKFLDTICRQDGEMTEFLLQYLGYCLTGLTDNNFFLYAYGFGANGKSTLFALINELLGDYADSIPIESLLLSKTPQCSATSYSLMRLKGARFIMSSEIPDGASLNESQMKDLTGGERITARNPYERPVSFDATHKMVLFGNHKLEIKGADHGIWRRVWLAPFEHVFKGSELRPRSEVLAELRQELPGVLNLAIAALKRLKDAKWQWVMPSKIKEATGEYKEESDPLKTFIEECLLQDEKAKVSLSDLSRRLSTWQMMNKEHVGEAVESPRKLADALRSRGMPVKKGAGNKTFLFGFKIYSGEARVEMPVAVRPMPAAMPQRA